MSTYRYTDMHGNEHLVEADGIEQNEINPRMWALLKPTSFDGVPYHDDAPARLLAPNEPIVID